MANKNFLIKNGLTVGGAEIVNSSGALTQSLITAVPSGAAASTQSVGNSSTAIATTAYVRGEIDALINSAPGTLNTLDELAAAINDDAAFNTTLTAAVALKAPLASPTFTGTVNAAAITATGLITGNTEVLSSANGTYKISIQQSGTVGYINSTGTDLIIRTGGSFTERLRIDSSGNVGIGTASVDHKLHVEEATANTACYVKVEAASWDAGIQLNNGNGAWEITNDYTGLGTTGALNFYGHSASRMTIDSSGKVGIGTTSPTSRLHVKSAGTGNVLYVESSDGHHLGGFYQESDTRAAFNVRDAGGSVKVNLDAGGDSWFTGGDVGIGLNNPSKKLHVSMGGTVVTGQTYDAMIIQNSDAVQLRIVDAGDAGGNGGHAGLGNDNGNLNIASAGVMTFSTALTANEALYGGGAGTGGDERMRINSGGDLFLGMTSGHHAASGRRVFEMSGTSSALIGFDIGGTYSTYIFDSGTSGTLEINHPNEVYLNADSKLRFATGSNVEAMTIMSDGDVGIGTTAPSQKLHVFQTEGSVGAKHAAIQFGGYAAYKDRGPMIAAYRATGNSNDQGLIFSTYDATNASNDRYKIGHTGKHEFNGAHQGDSVGHFIFSNQNTTDGTTTNCSLMVRNGNAQIQIMAWSSLGARIGTRGGGWSTNSNNTVHLTANDTANFILNTNGTPTFGNSSGISSDERLKKNIADLADGQLAKINALTPRAFEWKDSRKAGHKEGFIAQEVATIIPEAISEVTFAPDPADTSRDFEGPIKVINPDVMNARLIKAVQELSAELEAAKARITTLESS